MSGGTNAKTEGECNIVRSVLSIHKLYHFLSRRSLHAHIMLWLDPASRAVVESEITAAIPGVVAPGKEHLPPSDYHRYQKPACKVEDDLLYTVCRKQFHTCRPNSCCEKGSCSFGFPMPVQVDRKAKQVGADLRWSYHRPTKDCEFVVPYHPAIAAMWGGQSFCCYHCPLFSIGNNP